MNNLSVSRIIFLILSGFFVLYFTRDFNRLDNGNKQIAMFSRNSRTQKFDEQKSQMRQSISPSKRKSVENDKERNVVRMKYFDEIEKKIMAANFVNTENDVDSKRGLEKIGHMGRVNIPKNKKDFVPSLLGDHLVITLNSSLKRNELIDSTHSFHEKYAHKHEIAKESTFTFENVGEYVGKNATKISNEFRKDKSGIIPKRNAIDMIRLPMKHSNNKRDAFLKAMDSKVIIEKDDRFKQNRLTPVKQMSFSSKKSKSARRLVKLTSINRKENNANKRLYEIPESKENGAGKPPEKFKVAQSHFRKLHPSSNRANKNKNKRKIIEKDIKTEDELEAKQEDDNCPDNKDRYILKKLLQKWDHLATKNGIAYYFFFGTLLGYHRNGDILPWDTDVDVAVDARDYPVLRELASPRTFKYTKHDIYSRLVVQEDLTFPLVRRTRLSCDGRVVARNVDGCSFQDPMARIVRGDRHIDIFAMYQHNRTHIHEPTQMLTFHVNEVFPLKKCSFLDVKAKCPVNIPSVLSIMYGKEFEIPGKICIDGKWTSRKDIN